MGATAITAIDTLVFLQFGFQIKQTIGSVAFKMTDEYKWRSAELRKKLQTEGKVIKCLLLSFGTAVSKYQRFNKRRCQFPC